MDKFLIHKDNDGNVYHTCPASKDAVHLTHKSLHADKQSFIDHIQRAVDYNQRAGNVDEANKLLNKIKVLGTIDDINNMTDDEFMRYVECDMHISHTKIGWIDKKDLPENTLRNAWAIDANNNIVIDTAKSQNLAIQALKSKIIDADKKLSEATALKEDTSDLRNLIDTLHANLDQVRNTTLDSKFVDINHASLDLHKQAVLA